MAIPNAPTPGDPMYQSWQELQKLIASQQLQPMAFSSGMQYGVSTSSSNAGIGGGMYAQGMPPPPQMHTTSITFEVGDEVYLRDNGWQTEGVIGEVDQGKGILYIFNNDHKFDGGKGNVNPHSVGFSFSWAVYTSEVHSRLQMKKKKKKIVKSITLDPTKLDSLVIDKTVREEIVAVLEQHQNHSKLFDEWGLGEVIEYGRGMTFMFYGPPGTGKTWGATCIAKALGMELLTLSAAEIQSSEPGGANRAIQQAFKEATQSHKIVFLDECDSLISNRADLGMVLSGEVNTLLTEIEKFEGVAILATNRVEHMDEALERRISLIVEFPKPDFANRVKIWTKLLPKKLPLGKAVTVNALAKPELTGGQIKNVVLQASRMALAGKCDRVEQKHFDIAMERVNKSKNLMGTASRYRQGRVKDDFSMGSGQKTITKGLKDFLKVDTITDADNKNDSDI